MSPRLDVDLEVACEADGLPAAGDVQAWIAAALARGGREHAGRDREIAVRIVDEAEGRELNRRYRGKDSATNVLSFPAGDELAVPADAALPLGDLVLCAPVVAREAAAQGKPAAAHWAHLLVHGTLHLLGHDHEDDAEAAAMEALETEILAAGGLPDPYATEP